MARKGGGRRSYVRDGRGRFASTPGGGSGKKPAKGRSASTGRPQPRTFRQRQQASLDRRPGQGGYLGKATREAKAKLRASRARLKTNATPQQKAAVTRARIRAEGASPVTRMRLTAPAGVLKGAKVAKAPGRRGRSARSTLSRPISPAERPTPAKAQTGAGRQADVAPKPPKKQKKDGKKVDVQIKRAAPGGEYGPDGHFYSGGSWMPLGNFVGGTKKPVPATGSNPAGARKEGEGGNSSGQRVVRQKPKPRPRLQPAEKTPLPQVNVSSRGMQNMQDFFRNGFYTYYKKGRDGFIELKSSGWLREAALATRLPPKAVGSAIAKLRNMAKDKKEFDATVAWERDIARRDNYGYEQARRGGYIPRGMTRNQYDRVSQLVGAVGAIANERKARPNNRRNGIEEYVWVMNNILGTRQKRTPKPGKGAVPLTGAPRRIRVPSIGAAFRPVSTARLIAAGGSRWQKGAHDRIYFNQPGVGKVFYDRNTRAMVNQSGDAKGAVLAQRMERAGRRTPPRRWRTASLPRRRKPKA